MIDVLQFGAIGNGNDEYGALQEIIDRAPEGSTIYFPGSNKTLSSVEYVVYQPLLLTKSLSIVGGSGDVSIRGNNNSIFLIQPYKNDLVFSFENLQLLSGNIGINVSSSFSLSPISKINSVKFSGQQIGLNMIVQQLNFKVYNCQFSSNKYGIKTSSSFFFNNLIIRDCIFESSLSSAVKIDKASSVGMTSGSVKIISSCFINNAEAVNLNNISGTLNMNTYVNNQNDIITSGSGIVILVDDNV